MVITMTHIHLYTGGGQLIREAGGALFWHKGGKIFIREVGGAKSYKIREAFFALCKKNVKQHFTHSSRNSKIKSNLERFRESNFKKNFNHGEVILRK